jgi:hypothetical protein
LPLPHPTSLGRGPSGLRVLGAIRPHSGRAAPGLKAEMIAHAKNIFSVRIRNKECPKALGVYNPSDLVCSDLDVYPSKVCARLRLWC